MAAENNGDETQDDDRDRCGERNWCWRYEHSHRTLIASFAAKSCIRRIAGRVQAICHVGPRPQYLMSNHAVQ
jgi:hypothetical protein